MADHGARRRHHPGRPGRAVHHHCPPCGKAAFESRSDAKGFAKRAHPGDSLIAYRCPANDQFWHNGQPKRGDDES
ncbi:hypothetical protein [Saccharothrix lopnurensis]|uniref:Uncharacterized protein n=1 Tax=Saccharothrix lopnurensis TaxID=1670621 RepID=A0ABW1P5N5_9PSEU